MKRLMGVLIAVLLVAFAATPAMAQGPSGDRFCTGGNEVVRAEDSPRSVLLFGCGARIQKGAQVNRDVVSFGGDVVLEESTRVGNDVVVFGGNIDVSGVVDHDVSAIGGVVTLQSTAVVNGNVVTVGGVVNRKEGAIVHGQVLRNDNGTAPRFLPVTPIWTGWNFLGDTVWGFVQGFFTMIGLAALGALLLVFMPKHVKQVSDVAEKSALPSLGVGCLTWLLALSLMIPLIITCLGPFVLGLALMVAALFGWIAIAMLLGDRLLNALKVKNIVPILAMVVGLLILWLITSIPLLGFLILLFLAALAVGAVVLTRFGTQTYPLVPVASNAIVPVVPSAPATPVVPSEPTPPNDPGASI